MLTWTAAQRRAYAANASLFLINGVGFASWVSRIPYVREHIGLTDGQLGRALFAMALGAIMSFPLVGAGCARWGAKSTAWVIALIYPLTLLLPSWVHSEVMLWLALWCFGFTTGGMDVAMNAHAVSVERAVERPIMSSLHGVWSLGGILGAAGGALMVQLQVTPSFHFGLLAMVMWIVVLGAKPHLVETPPQPRTGSTFALPERRLWGLGAIIASSFIVEGAMADWTGIYLKDYLKMSPSQAALGFAFLSLSMMTMRFVGDWVSGRWGASWWLKRVMLLAMVMWSLALWLFHGWLTILAMMVTGMAIATVAPWVMRAAAQRSTHEGTGIASMATLGYTGFLLGPVLIGLLSDAFQLRWALAFLLVLMAVQVWLAPQLNDADLNVSDKPNTPNP